MDVLIGEKFTSVKYFPGVWPNFFVYCKADRQNSEDHF